MKNKPRGRIRKARVEDAAQIQKITGRYAVEADLVVRTLFDIYGQIRDYFVVEEKKKVAGFIALHVYWEDLAELRSFVVDGPYRGKGYGKKLFKEALKEAGSMGIKKVFVLTGIPSFFRKKGFKGISKKKLPHKIWKDCLNCPKFPDCEEEALIKRLK